MKGRKGEIRQKRNCIDRFVSPTGEGIERHVRGTGGFVINQKRARPKY